MLLGAYLGALLGLSLDLFGVILVSLGAILATLWPSLGSLRLLGLAWSLYCHVCSLGLLNLLWLKIAIVVM